VSVNWKLQVDKGPVRVYTTFIEGNPWICCKAEVTIPADRDDVWALVLNDYRMSEYDKMTAECAIVRKVTERAYVRRIASIAIWPVSRRDIVSLSAWDELSDGSFLMSTVSVDDPLVKPQSSFVRAFVLSGGYLVKPIRRRSESSSPECVLTFFAHSDLGGAIPSSIVNMLATQTPVQMCTQMSKSAADSKSRTGLQGKALTEDKEIQRQIDIVSKNTSEYKRAVQAGAGTMPINRIPSRQRLSLSGQGTIHFDGSSGATDNKDGYGLGSRDTRYSNIIPTDGSEPRSFCGYMNKEGRKVKSWKHRYFVLEKGILSYYESERSAAVLGEPIDLRDYTVSCVKENKQIILQQQLSHADAVNAAANTITSRNNRESGIPGTSSIVLPQALYARRQLLLELENEQAIDDWMQSFQEHIKYKNKLCMPDICTGYMRKQGRVIKNWKERFFVLDKGVLYYYDSSTSYSPAGAHDNTNTVHTLKAVGESMALTDNATVTVSPPNGLVVNTNGPSSRTLRLELDDPAELQRWRAALDEHIDYSLRGRREA
jgi:hypothetical protein